MVKIEIKDTGNVWINPLWLTDGFVYLDTSAGFELSLNKELQKLTDLNQLTIDTAIDTAIPATDKNLALLRVSMDVEMIDNDYPDHEIYLHIGHFTSDLTKLRVTGFSRESNEIEIQLIHS
jgi:hypothetical protein